MTIPEISRIEGLTPTHVAKLTMILRKGGFLTSTRGQLGGYTLSRAPEQIEIAAVLEALGGKLFDDQFCTRHGGPTSICAHAIDCSVRSLWQVVQTAVDEVLDRISLQDLMDKESPTTNVRLFAEPPRRNQVI
jgi:Rrf2 family protein